MWCVCICVHIYVDTYVNRHTCICVHVYVGPEVDATIFLHSSPPCILRHHSVIDPQSMPEWSACSEDPWSLLSEFWNYSQAVIPTQIQTLVFMLAKSKVSTLWVIPQYYSPNPWALESMTLGWGLVIWVSTRPLGESEVHWGLRTTLPLVMRSWYETPGV